MARELLLDTKYAGFWVDGDPTYAPRATVPIPRSVLTTYVAGLVIP
jgi:hypothetical protein